MEHSSYIKFAQNIKGKKIDRISLYRKFMAKVNKPDYDPNDIPALMINLDRLTKKATI